MRETHHILYLSLFLSLMLHLSIFYTVMWNGHFLELAAKRHKALVPVQMIQRPVEPPLEKMALNLPKPPPALAPLPLPEKPPPKKRVVKPKPMPKKVVKPLKKETKPKKKPPPSNTPKADPSAEDIDKIKPVFGVNTDSLTKSGESASAVRVGNTLMKAQEDEFTPPEEVKRYAVVPVFELSTMPVYKSRTEPEYPAELKSKNVEGEVLLSATIDKTGQVVRVTVKRSDNPLFTKAAVAAVKKFTFSPGLQNGKPVVTTIDIPIKFVLDE